LLNNYMDKAMSHAQFERIEDGTWFGLIPGLDGLWANAPTEEMCQQELRETLEGWILLGIAHHSDLSVVDGMTLESYSHECHFALH